MPWRTYCFNRIKGALGCDLSAFAQRQSHDIEISHYASRHASGAFRARAAGHRAGRAEPWRHLELHAEQRAPDLGGADHSGNAGTDGQRQGHGRVARLRLRHQAAGPARDGVVNQNGNAPIGTGPFRFKEWVRGSHILYERNPDYWGQPMPYLDRIVFKFLPDPGARSIAFENGTADIGYRTPVALSDLDRL